MDNINTILARGIGNGIVGLGMSTAYLAMTNHAFIDAVKDPRTIYAASVCAATGAVYGLLAQMKTNDVKHHYK